VKMASSTSAQWVVDSEVKRNPFEINVTAIQPPSAFSSKTAFTQHLIDSNLIDIDLVKSYSKLKRCDQCGKTFDRISNLKRHKVRIHQKQGYKCGHCNMKFSNVKDLEFHSEAFAGSQGPMCAVHMKRKPQDQSQTEKDRLPCKQCSKTFVTRWGLTYHTATFHGPKIYACAQCNSRFSRNIDLSKHVRMQVCNSIEFPQEETVPAKPKTAWMSRWERVEKPIFGEKVRINSELHQQQCTPQPPLPPQSPSLLDPTVFPPPPPPPSPLTTFTPTSIPSTSTVNRYHTWMGTPKSLLNSS
jgi:ribosomal protein L37AE/L43A